MLFVDDLKRNYNSYGLPERFIDALPDECPECGSPLEISPTLTGLKCSNPRCKSKLIMRIKAMCQDMGVLYFGESAISEFIDYYSVTNPLDIFELREGMLINDSMSQEMSDKIIRQIRNNCNFLLWEFVMVANLPYVRTSARKIFQGFESLEEAYDAIEYGGVEFIQSSLGIADAGEVSVQAMKVYSSLMEYKEELFEGILNVNIKNMKGVKELNVVCSDQVGGGFAKKADFYAYVNTEFADSLHVNFLPSVNKGIDYLVWAGADGSPARYTNKVKSVERYNEKGANIPILTATQFIEEMRIMVK